MRRSSVFWLCFLLILTGLSGPAAAKRVALVIGNDSYENVSDLQKAVNDAKAVGATLQSIGFAVVGAENVSRRDMNSQLQSFASKLEEGDEAVFFFAGHGVEIEGRNFLLPVDVPAAKPGQEDFVEAEAVSAARVLETIKRRGARVAILVLDACRDNPFQREGTRSLGGSRGLARMDASKGTFILLSADFGQTALDRLSNSDPDPNSVFTRSLIPMLKRPGLGLPQMARQVRVDVEQLALGVSHDQRPAYYDGITGDFFFAGEADLEKSEEAPTPVAAPLPPADNAVEVAFWNSVQSSDSPEAIREYLSRFPDGAFIGLAKLRLKALEQKQAALPPAQEAAPSASDVSEETELWNKVQSSDNADGFKQYLARYPSGRYANWAKDRLNVLEQKQAALPPAQEAAPAIEPQYANEMFDLAMKLGTGDGMPRNADESVRWLRRAADAGQPYAMSNLGLMYREGTLVPQDSAEAARWLHKAVGQGDHQLRREVQTILKRSGAYDGPIDGKKSAILTRAIDAFSKK